MSWCPLGWLAAGVACPGRVRCCGFSRGVWRGRVELVCRGAGRSRRHRATGLGAGVPSQIRELIDGVVFSGAACYRCGSRSGSSVVVWSGVVGPMPLALV